MIIIVKPSFKRDLINLRNRDLKILLDEKINQIEKAKDISQVTGLKLLRGYETHYRIKVESPKFKFRIGASIRKNTVFLIRFCPRKTIYKVFP